MSWNFRPCEVNMNTPECEAPVGSDRSIRTTCYACGNPACKACSSIVSHNGRRRRLCVDCLESHEIALPHPEKLRLGLHDPPTLAAEVA